MQRKKIFYGVFDFNIPTGGEKNSYQHVDILNASGFEAYALHERKGSRHRWFDNNTRIIDIASFWNIYNKERDYIVVSEALGLHTLSVPGKKVIFNKNLYLGYGSFGPSRPLIYPYHDPDVVAVFSVSDHNLQHLRFAFPEVKIYRVYAYIDCDLFAFRALRAKKRRIACVAKEQTLLSIVYHTLMARNVAGLNNLDEYEWTFLQGYSERDVARILQESLVLISLSTHEGLPRTILEGMACGCIVIGYGTGPLKECLPAEYQVETDDFMNIVQRIESIAKAFPNEIDAWTPQTLIGRKKAETFTKDRLKSCLVSAWKEIMS